MECISDSKVALIVTVIGLWDILYQLGFSYIGIGSNIDTDFTFAKLFYTCFQLRMR